MMLSLMAHSMLKKMVLFLRLILIWVGVVFLNMAGLKVSCTSIFLRRFGLKTVLHSCVHLNLERKITGHEWVVRKMGSGKSE